MRRSRKWLLGISILLVVFYLVWAISPYIFGGSPVRWTTVSKVTYPGGVELHTTALHEVFAFMFGPHLVVPFPFHHVDEDYERIVIVNGRERVRFKHQDINVYPSPAGKYVVVENLLFTSPPRIYHMLSDTELSWDKEALKKDLPGNPYWLTFQFIAWEDEEHFLIEVMGHSGSPDCRQAWRVEASTGSHELSTSTSRPAITPWG